LPREIASDVSARLRFNTKSQQFEPPLQNCSFTILSTLATRTLGNVRHIRITIQGAAKK